MFRKHMMSKMCAAAILCSGGTVLAQTIYKQIDANGRTIFTDRPTATDMFVLYETFPSQERGSVLPPRIADGTRSDVANALFSNSPMTSMYAASIDFKEATRRLRQARQSRQEDVQPWLGERTDSAGTSAMSKRYQRRQQRLEREVVAAERRLHHTSLVLSALLRVDAKTDRLKLAQP